MQSLLKLSMFSRIGVIAAFVAAALAPTAHAGPTMMRTAPAKVYLGCKLSPVSENLALMLRITNPTRLTVPNGATVTYTQSLGHPDKYYTIVAKAAVSPGGQMGQDVANPELTSGPCTAWFMSSPINSVGTPAAQ